MRRDGYVKAAKKTRPWRSGFCGLDLPATSHRRCTGNYVGRPCICTCHQEAPVTTTATTGLKVYDKLEQRSDKWYDLRRGILTASVVGKMITPTLKVADNDTSRGITASLVAERITGTTEKGYVSDDMWRGIEHEPFARDIYSGHYQQAVECGFMRRDEDGWTLGLSPDGLVGSDGLIEIKCPRAKGHVSTILGDCVPPYYMGQCQAALLVSGRKWLDYVSFCAGLPLFVKRVLPDPAWHEAIVAACVQFETTAAEMVAAYTEATEHMPATERVEMEIVI